MDSSQPKTGRPKGRTEPLEDTPCDHCGRVLPTYSGWLRHLRQVHGIVPDSKRCSQCRETKPLIQFESTRLDARGKPVYRGACAACRGRSRPKRAKTQGELDRDRRHAAKRYFGLTLEEYDSAIEMAMADQDGCCAVCLEPLGGEHQSSPHLDHCHKTGKLRGVLCRKCNLALGFLKDSTDSISRLLDYMVKEDRVLTVFDSCVRVTGYEGYDDKAEVSVTLPLVFVDELPDDVQD